MTLHLCLDCAVVWNCYEGASLICSRCERSLELEDLDVEPVKSFAQIAGEAIHGPAPKARRRWEVG